MRILRTLCLSATLGLVVAGCATTAATESASAESASAAERAPTDSLALWLRQAPKPEVVACSVDKATAPEAVERFDALSAKVCELYRRVYDDAQKVVVAPASELALLPEGADTDWKTSAQTAVTAHYQETLRAIEEQRKALADYTETLRADNAISNITSKLRQTALLVRAGDDSAKLGRQLRATEEGALLVLRRRIAATLGR